MGEALKGEKERGRADTKASVTFANPQNKFFSRLLKTKDFKNQLELYLIMLPVLILVFVFCYLPMYGIVIAFQDWYPGTPFFDFGGATIWVGLKNFQNFITNPYFWRLIKNTITLSMLNLGIAFWIPILFSLLLNEINAPRYKKFIQTASYLPYFISSVVVAGMVLSFVASDGIVNSFLKMLGMKPFILNMQPQYFPLVYTLTNIWRNFGWGSILYLSSMASIDPALYEAAGLDGAGRWKKMWHITLPGIKPTIMIMLIMGVGGMLGADSDMILLLYSPATYEHADVIGTYLYRYGLVGGNFSYGTAVGLFIAVINFALVYGANKISAKVADYSLW